MSVENMQTLELFPFCVVQKHVTLTVKFEGDNVSKINKRQPVVHIFFDVPQLFQTSHYMHHNRICNFLLLLKVCINKPLVTFVFL
jgi:hypothetical protein